MCLGSCYGVLTSDKFVYYNRRADKKPSGKVSVVKQVYMCLIIGIHTQVLLPGSAVMRVEVAKEIGE